MSYDRRLGAAESRVSTKSAFTVLFGIAIVGLIGVLTLFGGFFTVHQTERAVVTRMGAFHYVAGPGFHLKLPFLDGVRDFTVSMQSVRVDDAETFTVDNQLVKVDMVVQYEIPDAAVERVFREVPDHERRLVSMAVDRMKQVLGGHNIAELPSKRGEITNKILTSVRSEAERLYGLNVLDLQLVDLEYSKAFKDAIDLAAVAKAKVEQAEQQRREADVVAQTAQIQARAQAQVQIERARGEADSRRQIAAAEADSIRLRGEAEAKAIQAQAEALGANPALVQLRQAERWDGKLPSQVYGPVPMPIITQR